MTARRRACAALGLALTLVAPSGARQDDPITWRLATEPVTLTTTPGATVTLVLTAEVDTGWHLYATVLPDGGPKPTKITVPAGQEFAAAGDVDEPAPSSSFDKNFNMTLDYHEGTVTFGIPVKSKPTSSLGAVPVRVAVAYQTCNDSFCLPPQQVIVSTSVQIRPDMAKQPPAPPDRDAFNKAIAVKDLDAQLAAITKYATDFPDSDTVYFAVARGMRNLADADGATPTRLAAFVRGIEAVIDGAAGRARAYQRADVYYTMASRLVARGVLVDDAARLAGKGVPLLNHADFIAKERATHDARQAALSARTPGREADPFPLAESEERWAGIRANHLSVLGRAQLAQGRTADATAALNASFAIAPVMETALALSTLAERAGRMTEALDYAVTAQLTGKMTAPEFAHLERLYKATHGGSLDGLEALLDRTFAARHVNPVTTTRYVATSARTSRTVLAEMFTGAACLPCISVDLSLERVMERYSRSEVVLLVYHIHAPTSDPYSNFAVEARSAFYGVHAAPTVLLDGTVAPVGEGGGPLATTIFPKLDAAIRGRLETPAGLTIDLAASRTATGVSATATPRGTLPQTARMHVVLVETASSYSGENGLRIQPMIVRDVQTGAPGQAVTWTVDLAALAKKNLEYYDWYVADLKQRANLEATFRETRATVDGSKLAVVAFVQDDATHAVLQAAFVPVR